MNVMIPSLLAELCLILKDASSLGHHNIKNTSFLYEGKPDHSGCAVWGMNCLSWFKRCDRGFESHSRHGCLCVRFFCVCSALCGVAALRRADQSSEEYYYLCKKKYYETEEETRAQQRALDSLMNECVEENCVQHGNYWCRILRNSSHSKGTLLKYSRYKVKLP
jgi:hypothetical protein